MAILIVAFQTIRDRAFLLLAGSVILGHLVLISGWENWWAGHCYGPRLTTDLVPWFLVLGVLGLDGARVRFARRAPRRILGIVGACLLLISVYMHGWGAISPAGMEWNRLPTNIRNDPNRAWSWKRPQFLAGIQPMPE